MMMELGKLGTGPVANPAPGMPDQAYDETQNPWLIQNVTAGNAFTPYRHPMDPDTLARLEVAQAIVAAIRTIAWVKDARVVQDPASRYFGLPPGVTMWAVEVTTELVDGSTQTITVNAGNIAGNVMGNDVWKPSVRAKSVEICDLLGIFPQDSTLADKIWDQIF